VIRQYWLKQSRLVAMPAPMSMDLRLRIVHAVESGSSIRGAAQRFAVSPSAAIKLMQRVLATGSAAPARYGGHRRPVLEPHEADLRQLVEATPDLTLAELQTALQQRCGVRAGLSTIHTTLRRIGLRLKKSPCERPSRTGPTSPASAGGGAAGSLSWTRRASSSSTRPPPPPT
jgi:putative transposase